MLSSWERSGNTVLGSARGTLMTTAQSRHSEPGKQWTRQEQLVHLVVCFECPATPEQEQPTQHRFSVPPILAAKKGSFACVVTQPANSRNL